tara:strand:+ start:53 stop:319 length:267 start_codon:yes stop_codon:yes gene_type:complete
MSDLRKRADELAESLIKRLFRLGEHIDKSVVWEPIEFTADMLEAFAAEVTKQLQADIAATTRQRDEVSAELAELKKRYQAVTFGGTKP